MVFSLFRKDPRRRLIESLHDRIVEAARAPGLYAELGVPDTVEGRFEALCLHAMLTLRALKRWPAPAEEVAQDLVDELFRQLDNSLRELGVGDYGVPKRMKRLAQAFYGRARAYDAALDASDPGALAAALGRNVLGTDAPADALAVYVAAAERSLAGASLETFLNEGPPFPPATAAALPEAVA